MDSTTATTSPVPVSSAGPPPRSWRSLTVMGDSIAAGIGDPAPGVPDLPWADQLAAHLGVAGGAYRNLGVPGLRLAQIQDTQLASATDPAADVTVLAGGGNDLFDRNFDPDDLCRSLEAMVGTLTEAGSTVVTFGLFDLSCTELVAPGRRPSLRERTRRLNAVTRQVTLRHGGCFVDFFDHPEQSPAIFSADQLHPDRRGHALIARDTAAALLKVASRTSQRGVRF